MERNQSSMSKFSLDRPLPAACDRHCSFLKLSIALTRQNTEESLSKLAGEVLPLALEEANELQKRIAPLLFGIQESKNMVQQLEIEHNKTESSVKALLCQISKLDERKTAVVDETKQLLQRIDERNCADSMKDMIKAVKIVKEILQDLEKKESDLLSACQLIHLDMEESVGYEGHQQFAGLDQTLCISLDKLTTAKTKLAAMLRAILSVKRKIGDMPSQVELIQYERRFSELYSQIQEKHRQTSKFYDTYNSLSEIKELMLKETSLLNSINSQFRDALTSSFGRTKLVDSMEVIVKGAQQKLEKVQLSFLAETRNSDSLRKKYTTAVADQRHFSSLLKAFEDECAKNERLRLAS